MLIIATFKHSVYLELALRVLQQKGISKDALLAAVLNEQTCDDATGWEFAHRNGKSPYDLAFIFAMIFMLLGGIYGFVLPWGPIIWSIIGIVAGALCGLVVDYCMGKISLRASNDKESEVVLMIQCETLQTDTVESVLWKHQALRIAKIPN